MTIITIPRILQEKLTEEGADALVEILDKVEERSEAHTLQVAEERFEKKLEQVKFELKEDISKVDKRLELVKSELKQEISDTKAELREEISKVDRRLEQVRAELKTDIANVRADLIKWMFIFWAGQVITITGILIAFLKK